MEQKRHRFTVLIEQDEDGTYIADVPELKGCHTQARTMDELMSRIREAIELYLEDVGEEPEKTRFVGLQQIEV